MTAEGRPIIIDAGFSHATLLHPDKWVANGIEPPKSSVTRWRRPISFNLRRRIHCGARRCVEPSNRVCGRGDSKTSRRCMSPEVAPKIALSDPLYRNGEYISEAALGLDDARRARIALELAPQAENLHIDAAVEDILVNAGRLQ
jgi:hypothetical protein